VDRADEMCIFVTAVGSDGAVASLVLAVLVVTVSSATKEMRRSGA
jgi:hypothetical protein